MRTLFIHNSYYTRPFGRHKEFLVQIKNSFFFHFKNCIMKKSGICILKRMIIYKSIYSDNLRRHSTNSDKA